MSRARVIAAFLILAGVGAGTFWFVRRCYFSESADPDARMSRRIAEPLTDRLVMVLVDSVPFELAFDGKTMPYLARLAKRGTYGLAITEEPTITGQMVYTIATGARPYMRGIVRNWRQNRMQHETFLHGLRAAGLKLHLYGDAPWDQMFGHLFDESFALAEDGRSNKGGRPIVWKHPINDLDRRVLRELDRAVQKEQFDLLLFHVAGTDLVMHRYLRDSLVTRDKLNWADLLLQGLVRQLDDGRTTFLIFSDHGCAPNGRHGYSDPDARRAFYLLYGPTVVTGQRRDARQIDLSPTVSALFGRTPAAPSAGRPLVEAFAVSPPSRALFLIEAAAQRVTYLRRHDERIGTGLRPRGAAITRARRLSAQGRPVAAASLAGRLLDRLRRAELDHRLERRTALPLLMWLTLLLAIGGLTWIASGIGPGAGTTRRPVALALAGGAAVAFFAVSVFVNARAGRFFNSHYDVWPILGKVGLLVGLVIGLAIPGALAWRRRVWLQAALAPWGFAAAAALMLVLGALPGYFQGLYALGALLAVASILLLIRVSKALAPMKGASPRAAWAEVLPWAASVAILLVAFLWQFTWRPDLFRTRVFFQGYLGAAAAVAAFLLAAWSVARAGGERDEPDVTLLGPAIAFAVALLLRHAIFPLPGFDRFDTSGAHLAAELDTRIIALGVMAAIWLALHLRGMRGASVSALGALALLSAWGSPFEGMIVALFVAALAPFRRLAFWRERPVAGVVAAALLLLGSRILFCQIHEFHFNFTALHELTRFAPDIDAVWGRLALPVAIRYTLPALILLPLLWGRLSRPAQLQALLLVVIYAAARALHILVLGRLTLDQLYVNWRGFGELAIMGLWLAGLAVAFALWWRGWPKASGASTMPPPAPVTRRD